MDLGETPEKRPPGILRRLSRTARDFHGLWNKPPELPWGINLHLHRWGEDESEPGLESRLQKELEFMAPVAFEAHQEMMRCRLDRMLSVFGDNLAKKTAFKKRESCLLNHEFF